jgi:predicted nuclease of predicted toxin-antitoxin system
MLLLIDENVPTSIAEFFTSRGHEVKFVLDLLPGGTPDPVIATVGDRLAAIVVTWDRDFDRWSGEFRRETARDSGGWAGSAFAAIRPTGGGFWSVG